MSSYNENTVRNVAFVAHTGAGKTTLCESLLFNHGKTTRLGSVTEGNTVSDFDPIEIERKISISLSLMNFTVGEVKINLLDTPGYADFILELLNGATAVDAAIVVVGASDGIQVGTMRAWEVIEKQGLPRAVYISKLDKENTDFFKTVEAIQGSFGKECVPVFVPIISSGSFKGVANLLTKAGMDQLSGELKAKAESLREAMIELVAEVDDAFVEKYLNGETLSDAEITAAFEKALFQRRIVPILCGQALTAVGIKELAGLIAGYFPAPARRAQEDAVDSQKKEPVRINVSSSEPLSGFVFKTISDPHVGQISVFKIVSGRLNSNTEFYNVEQESVERIGQLYILQGKEQLPVDAIAAGDIGAVAKLKNTHTGDSMGDAKRRVLFNKKMQREPSISYSLKPKTRQDEDKISQALARLTIEDQGIRTSRDSQTKELILSGMGDMHLEITIDKLRRRYHVDVEVGTPKVPYKETIKKQAKMHHKHKKQSGGHGQYGDVWLQLDPLPRGGEFEFVDKVVGGVVPRQFIPSVEKGVRKVLTEGALAGYPLVDLRVTLYDGSYHDVDSSDMAFQIAGGMALRKGVLEASPILLEPIMDVEIVIPEDFLGAVNGDLSSRRGRVSGMEAAGSNQKIRAHVPLAEMLRYATDLRSLTHGQGAHSMTFLHYEEVPARIAEKIIAVAKFEHHKEEE